MGLGWRWSGDVELTQTNKQMCSSSCLDPDTHTWSIRIYRRCLLVCIPIIIITMSLMLTNKNKIISHFGLKQT